MGNDATKTAALWDATKALRKPHDPIAQIIAIILRRELGPHNGLYAQIGSYDIERAAKALMDDFQRRGWKIVEPPTDPRDAMGRASRPLQRPRAGLARDVDASKLKEL